MLAARSGSSETVTRLVETGADINAKEKGFGQTALMVAAGLDRPDVVRLLMAAPFFAYAEPFCRLRGLRDGLRLGPALVIGGVAAAASIARLRQNELGPMIQRLQEQIVARSDESSPIIAAPPFHPIVRRDVFYAWSRTTDPHGYTTEPAMRDLGYGDFVSADHYREELARHDPSVIVLPLPGEDLYDPLQWQILSEFLRRNAGRYEIVTEGFIRPFAVKHSAADAL
jgi:hypothetical protein